MTYLKEAHKTMDIELMATQAQLRLRKFILERQIEELAAMGLASSNDDTQKELDSVCKELIISIMKYGRKG